ncbi:signal peptide-containing protein [Theileria equi strain WA]|uniref:Signal peptide-containing protein n=1 Tax=Theileria equi strain WA TaxID=1537102 RepID=L0AYR6_THEEQ|nr:signal peptide-containing protein [Theileria equi strain WA]AFZ80710.1 signal peptide-containing protein [Theileria equi strain WA]|eukprot:XP_004830376.1 signal peptide-containing protein [Theileria equi strain WA]
MFLVYTLYIFCLSTTCSYGSDTTSVKPPESCFTLDLSAPYGDRIDVLKGAFGEYDDVSYYPNTGNCIDEVRDGQETIWTAEGNDKCVMAYSISKQNGFSLLLLRISNGNVRYGAFEKVEGKWKSFNKEEFENRWKHLVDSTAPTSKFPDNISDLEHV